MHHTRVHGESLPNRTCKGCERDFYDAKAQRKYCPDCNPNAGEHNGNWKDAKEEAECRVCGTAFEYYPSDKRGLYCAPCVEEVNGGVPERPDQRVVRIPIACRYCDTRMEVLPSRIRGRTYGVFCDQDCYAKWLSETIVGERHHQWEGGTFPYGEEWWTVRRKALRRDAYTCQVCGVTAEQLGRNPDVHHIDRVRDFSDPTDAHDLDNVISLCRPCHRLVEEGRIDLPEAR